MPSGAEGSFIRGYMVIFGTDGQDFEVPEFSLVNGELEDGRFRLAFTILQDPFDDEEVTMSMGHDQFSFGRIWFRVNGSNCSRMTRNLKGTYELTR